MLEPDVPTGFHEMGFAVVVDFIGPELHVAEFDVVRASQVNQVAGLLLVTLRVRIAAKRCELVLVRPRRIRPYRADRLIEIGAGLEQSRRRG